MSDRLSEIRQRDNAHTHSLEVPCDVAFLLSIIDDVKAESASLRSLLQEASEALTVLANGPESEAAKRVARVWLETIANYVPAGASS